jgi:anti-anti-sigma factor
VLESEARGDRHTLALAGELDLAAASELEGCRRRECADGARDLHLDLCRLSFVDGAGVRAMLTRGRSASKVVAGFVSMAPNGLRRVLELTGVLQPLDSRQMTTGYPAAASD